MNSKKLVAISCCLLLVVAGIGATFAYFTDSEEATNTFTVGDVEISLTETWNTDSDDDNDSEPDKWTAQVVPGTVNPKDPVVSVLPDTNIDCYLFVKFEETGNPSTYFTYTSLLTKDEGWTRGDDNGIPSNVWYRVVFNDDEVKSWNLLKDNQIIVKDTVTEEMVDEAAAASLKYTAYGVQKAGIASVEAAWAEVSNQ